MTARRPLQIAIVGIFVVACSVLAWALWQLSRHQMLLGSLAERGVRVEGSIVAKRHSYPRNSSRSSFVIEVEHRYAGRSFSNPYAASRSHYHALHVGDSVDVTLLPDDPGMAQLTEVVNGDTTYRGLRSAGSVAPRPRFRRRIADPQGLPLHESGNGRNAA
jgi:hypothetical protein